MPAVSRHQQRLFGHALAYKRGETKEAPDRVKRIADTLDEETIRHFAETPTEGLPEKVANEILEGGPGDGKPDSDFDPKALKKGLKEEMEHTTNPQAAKEIAKDHLVENPQEYSKDAGLGAAGVIKPVLGLASDVSSAANTGGGSHPVEQAANSGVGVAGAASAAEGGLDLTGAAEPLLARAGVAGKALQGAAEVAGPLAGAAMIGEGIGVLANRSGAREKTEQDLEGKGVLARAGYGIMNPMKTINAATAGIGDAIRATGDLKQAEIAGEQIPKPNPTPKPDPQVKNMHFGFNRQIQAPHSITPPASTSVPQPMDKQSAQRRCNLLARRMDRSAADAAIDKFLGSLGMERDDAGEIKQKAFAPRLHKCPQCQGGNARIRTAHEDTGMECQEMKCPDCGFFCEDIDDLNEKENPSHAQGESGGDGKHEGEINKAAAAQSPVPLTGPEAIAHALEKLDLGEVESKARAVITGRKVSKRPHAVQVLNVLEGLKRNNLRPSDLLIRSVPVIPPAFRPFSVVGNTFVPGDANELYRDLIHLRDGYQEARDILGDEGTQDTRLALYDAVKALYGYGEPTAPKTKQRGVAGFLKQVSGTSPKWSFFQRKMISKPMDSVSRGTITVDPDLSLDEVGVPEDMAWTMYKPYIQRRLTMSMGMSPADSLTHVTDRTEHARKALLKEMQERPVIYTRAPSWHKFNVLAGHPKLIEGKTIAINPLVTTGQNADFDGDAMNLHVPSHPDAVKEAYEKLLPSKMLWSIRDQDKVMPQPKQEQILGAFTAVHRPAKNKFKFASRAQAVEAIRRGQVSLSDEVEVPDDTPLPS